MKQAFWIFQKIKATLKGRRFQHIEDTPTPKIMWWWHWKLLNNRSFQQQQHCLT